MNHDRREARDTATFIKGRGLAYRNLYLVVLTLL